MRQAMVRSAAALILMAAIGGAQAQGAASAPPMGHGMGMQGMHGMQGMRMNADNTPGWSMMSRDERQAHHDKMMGMKDYAECHAYMEQHHAQMVERAKERGRKMPGEPRHDACVALKKQ